MASSNTDLEVYETEEQMLEKFKRERKESQAQIMKLKHSIPKGDKKKKKEVQEEIAKLEASLDVKQKEDMDKWKLSTKSGSCQEESVEEHVAAMHVGTNQDEEALEETPYSDTNSKKSKAQRRRDKKQNKDKERDERIKEQEVINRQGPRIQELKKITAMLKSRGKVLHEIAADGNCMYNAVAHQLSARNLETSNEELRKQTSDYMRSHSDDFLPFLTNSDTGDMMTQEEFLEYCRKTEKLPVWGGQLELRALSQVLRVPIEVIQADMTQPLVIGDHTDAPPITVIYQRHAFRLGEHYNSVADRKEEEDVDDEIQENGLT